MTILEVKEKLLKKQETIYDSELKNRLNSLIIDLSKLFGEADVVEKTISDQISYAETSIETIDYNWIIRLHNLFFQMKNNLVYVSSKNKEIDKIKKNIDVLELKRVKLTKKKNIFFWLILSLVLIGVVTICILALVQWVQKGKGVIEEFKWDLMALTGILDTLVGVVGLTIERVLDHRNSQKIHEIDIEKDKMNEMYKGLYMKLYTQYISDHSSGYQDSKVYNIGCGGE